MSDYEERGRAVRGGQMGDMVVPPGSYAHILKINEGKVTCAVGPTRVTLSQQDHQLVSWDPVAREFVYVDRHDDARKRNVHVPDGSYAILHNPAVEEGKKHPPVEKQSEAVDLNDGHIVIVKGPISFALWPRQHATVIEGHRLRSDQYLIARVVNERDARENWQAATIKPQAVKPSEGDEEEAALLPVGDPSLTTGQRLVFRGTEMAFFIPPTGIEVVPDDEGNYVRDAVSLERLKYCVLVDESGAKRYLRGPQVVFPRPTETFYVEDGVRIFAAIELNANQGIYIKVTADGDGHNEGDEVFITGKDRPIYFPREDHAIIEYGSEKIHYAIAIPNAGEGRYVLDRDTGEVSLVRGPKMFLPNPIKQVIVQRILSPEEARLYFPGNREVEEVNDHFRQLADDARSSFLTAREALRGSAGLHGDEELRFRGGRGHGDDDFSARIASEKMARSTKYTPPRTITFDNKYDGAVTLDIWPGYAVLVMNGKGERHVEIGPSRVLLKYDEQLMPFKLSTGRPKSDDNAIREVYLRVKNNKVTDVVKVETADFATVTATVAYRVNFVGDDPERWFAVENYIQLLVDHARSRLASAAKKVGIQKFFANSTEIVRDTILGVQGEDGNGRSGLRFDDNEMHVYDVDVLDIHIDNREIAQQLVSAQHEAVRDALRVTAAQRELAVAQTLEEVNRQKADATAETAAHAHTLRLSDLERSLVQELREWANKTEVSMKQALDGAKVREARLAAEQNEQGVLSEIARAKLARQQAELDQTFSDAKRRLDAEVESVTAQLKAAGDAGMPEAITLAAKARLAEQVSRDMAPITAIFGGNAQNAFENMLAGRFFHGLLDDQEGRRRNGRHGVSAGE